MTCCCVMTNNAGVLRGTPATLDSAEGIIDLVTQAGGKDGYFRGALAWNSWSDVDFHMHERGDEDHIYYNSHNSNAGSFNPSKNGGEIDVDMNVGSASQSRNSRTKSRPAVENIVYPFERMANMKDGDYKFSFVQYGVWSGREAGNDAPYLLVEHRLPHEEKLSHYALFKYKGNNLPSNTGHNEPLVTVNKVGQVFTIKNFDCNKLALVKAHDIRIEGSCPTDWNSNGAIDSTANASLTGENPIS